MESPNGKADRRPGRAPRRPARVRSRARRRGRLWAWAGAALVVVLLAVGTAARVAYDTFNGNIHSTDISRRLGTRPTDLHPRAHNILVIGSDSRAGTHGASGKGFVTAQSDTLMIVHIAANRRWAAVVSVPRDSWVEIPACDEGHGRRSTPHHFKINEAFALGSLYGGPAGGAACTIKTLEHATHVHIDHVIVVDFAGFRRTVNALGGVEVTTRTPIDDPRSRLVLPAGRHVLRGREALAYVRARYGLGDGSDLERIRWQQAFVAAMVRKARSRLYDPAATYRFLNAATRSLTTDRGLGSLRALYGLAADVKGIPGGKIDFVTVPTFPRQAVVPGDTANVLWKQPLAGQIFAALRTDTPIRGVRTTHAAAHRPR